MTHWGLIAFHTAIHPIEQTWLKPLKDISQSSFPLPSKARPLCSIKTQSSAERLKSKTKTKTGTPTVLVNLPTLRVALNTIQSTARIERGENKVHANIHQIICHNAERVGSRVEQGGGGEGFLSFPVQYSEQNVPLQAGCSLGYVI